MDITCDCDFTPLAKGCLPNPIPSFEPKTKLEIEVLIRGQLFGKFQIMFNDNNEHHLGSYLIGAYRQAHLDCCLGNLILLEKVTTILKICKEHNFIKIDINSDSN